MILELKAILQIKYIQLHGKLVTLFSFLVDWWKLHHVVGNHCWTRLIGFHIHSFVQSLSRVRLCDPRECSTPGYPFLHYLPKFAQTPVHRVDDTIQSSHPLLFPSFAVNLSQHRVFSSELALCSRWSKYWSFSFSLNPSSSSSFFFFKHQSFK